MKELYIEIEVKKKIELGRVKVNSWGVKVKNNEGVF